MKFGNFAKNMKKVTGLSFNKRRSAHAEARNPGAIDLSE